MSDQLPAAIVERIITVWDRELTHTMNPAVDKYQAKLAALVLADDPAFVRWIVERHGHRTDLDFLVMEPQLRSYCFPILEGTDDEGKSEQ